MRVKIGHQWFDSKNTPICIQYSDGEREQINNNPGPQRKYAVFPEGWGSPDEMRAWMVEATDQGEVSSNSKKGTY
jgi:hypothetical protein